MNDFKIVVTTFFDNIWKLFVKTDFPGIGVSLAGVLISVLIARFSIRLFHHISGFGANGSDYGRVADHGDKVRSAVKWKNRRQIGFK